MDTAAATDKLLNSLPEELMESHHDDISDLRQRSQKCLDLLKAADFPGWYEDQMKELDKITEIGQ